MWIVYALFNKDAEKLYIGLTSNVERRLIEHNLKRGNHFTARVKGQWEIIYKVEYENKAEAIKREKKLKSYRGREFIKKFIPL